MTGVPSFDAKWRPDPVIGCWIWVGALTADGYGNFWWRGINYYAHRFAWTALRSRILIGDEVLDHLCRVRCCVNPAHLDPITPTENTARGAFARREFPRGLRVKISDDCYYEMSYDEYLSRTT